MATAQVVSWLSHGIWRAVHSTRAACERTLRKRLPSFLDIDNPPDPGEWIWRWFCRRVLPAILAVVTMVAGAIVIGPVIIALSLTSMAFGVRSALAGLLLSISVEATPPGSWVVEQIEAPDPESNDLNHSALIHPVIAANVLKPWVLRGPLRGALPAVVPCTFDAQVVQQGVQEYILEPAFRGGPSGKHSISFDRTATLTVAIQDIAEGTVSGVLELTLTDSFDEVTLSVPSYFGEEFVTVPRRDNPTTIRGEISGPADRLYFHHHSADNVHPNIRMVSDVTFSGWLSHHHGHSALEGVLTEKTEYFGTFTNFCRVYSTISLERLVTLEHHAGEKRASITPSVTSAD
jgi:hypothetical protein